jgi:AraC-like DNA-binding protein
MQTIIYDTGGIRAAERYDWWATQVSENFGIVSALAREDRDSFAGRLEVFAGDAISLVRFASRGHVAERLRPQIRRIEWGSYVVYREHAPGAWFEIGGRECRVLRGDLLIADPDMGMRTGDTAGYHHDIWMLPKALLDPHLPAMPRPMMIHLPASSGLTGLIAGYIDALSRMLTELSMADIAGAADHLGRLIAIGCGGAARAHGEAIRAARQEQVRRFVDRHLAAPELSADHAAAAMRIPLRELHALFGEGESFSAMVRRRRLERCRAILESGGGESITAIAFDNGFGSLPTFYRAFSDAFGMAPMEMRSLALRG